MPRIRILTDRITSRPIALSCVLWVVVAGVAMGVEPYTIRSANPLVQPWRISHFHELKDVGLKCIAEDGERNIWFGTGTGVIRYDGIHWQTFGVEQGLPGIPVRSIDKLNDGTLVASTSSGVFQFDGTQWVKLFPRDGVPIPCRSVTQTSDSAIWIACSWGAIRLANDQATLLTASSHRSLAQQLGWFDAVRVIPDHCFRMRAMYNGTGLALTDNHVVAVAQDGPAAKEGIGVGDRLLSVNGSRQVSRALTTAVGEQVDLTLEDFQSKDRKTVTVQPVAVDEKFRDASISSIMEDRQGRVWLGATFGRVSMSPDQGQTWKVWSLREGNRFGKSPKVMQRANGEIWVVSRSRNGGVSRLDDDQWTEVELGDSPFSVFATAIAETADETIWVGGQNRIYINEQGQWSRVDTRTAKVPSAQQQFLSTTDGALWMIGHDQYAVRVSISPNEFWTLRGVEYHCTDVDGNSWYIDSKTARVIRDDGRTTVSFGPEDGVIEKPIAVIALPTGGVIAIGSHQNITSVATLTHGEWIRKQFPLVAQGFTARGSTVAKDGRVWIAAKGTRNDGQVGGIVAGIGDEWQHFHPPSAPVYASALLELPNGNIWASGSFGVMEYDGSQWRSLDDPLLISACVHGTKAPNGDIWYATRQHGLVRYRDGEWRSITRDFGVAFNEAANVAVTSNGVVWSSTTGGLVRFDGKRFSPVKLPEGYGRRSLLASDGGLWIDHVHRYRPEKGKPTATTVQSKLSSDQGSAAVLKVRGVDRWNRTPAEDLEWSYQVDHGPWSEFQVQDGQIVISGLDAGDHEIRVRNRDFDWNVSEPTEAVQVSVLPPVWLRSWFLLTAFVLFSLIASLILVLFRRGIALRDSHRELESARSLLAERFAEQSAQYRAVCDQSPIGIFVTDTEGNVSYFNYCLQKLTGLTTEEAIGSGWARAIHPDDRQKVIQSWQRTLTEQQPFQQRARFQRGDGSISWFDAVANRIESNGQIIGYVGAVEDITEELAANARLHESNEKLHDALGQLKMAQDQAIRRERLSALGQMAAGVAHDINNSLAPLLSYTELLAADSAIDSVNRERIDLIRLGVRDTAKIVKRLEHFYRESHNREFLSSVDLAEVATQTIELTRPKWQDSAVAERKQVRVDLRIECCPVVDGDPSQLRSVLTNLIFNSVDAIERSGTVTIRVDREADCAVLEIVDDGVGMDEQQLSHCMEPFFTSKDRGSGLGLSECHGVIRQHGGQILIDSVPRQGTTVRITLPGARERTSSFVGSTHQSASRETSTQQSHNAVLHGASVLYVDDDESVRRSTVALFRSMGISVTTACDGPEALSLLSEHSFQLLMCDQGMPGMDGIAVLQEAKKLWPNLPVVIVSGWALDNLRGGPAPDAFLEKPVALEELRSILALHLDKTEVA